MKLWLYSRLLNTFLKMNVYNRFYLQIWRLWHIEKMKQYNINPNNHDV
jgi:hypothetical protein